MSLFNKLCGLHCDTIYYKHLYAIYEKKILKILSEKDGYKYNDKDIKKTKHFPPSSCNIKPILTINELINSIEKNTKKNNITVSFSLSKKPICTIDSKYSQFYSIANTVKCHNNTFKIFSDSKNWEILKHKILMEEVCGEDIIFAPIDNKNTIKYYSSFDNNDTKEMKNNLSCNFFHSNGKPMFKEIFRIMTENVNYFKFEKNINDDTVFDKNYVKYNITICNTIYICVDNGKKYNIMFDYIQYNDHTKKQMITMKTFKEMFEILTDYDGYIQRRNEQRMKNLQIYFDSIENIKNT